MSWEPHDAVLYARQHSHLKSGGHCARAVAAAIRAGGVRIEGADAKNFWRSLENAGFTKVYGTPLEGDVAVIEALPGPGQYGHAFMTATAPGILILRSAVYTPAHAIGKFSPK